VVLFVANLDYGPNADAAITLVERVLPALTARYDRPVRVVLVGSYDPGGPLGELASRPGVTLAGFVNDLSAYYARAAVVVAPLATGGGTRIKLLEAFAHQVPLVTTPVGAAGLAVVHREHVLIGETPEELATAAVELLGSPALARTMTTAALRFVRRYHAAPVVAERVKEFLDAASGHEDLTR
jgi:glycosyltransferase involved in cell wall biosynthesis